MSGPLIVGVIGSLRSKCNEQQMKKLILEIEDELMLNTIIEKVGRDQTLSNTDICLMAALFGAKRRYPDFEIVNLKNYIKADSIANLRRLERLVNSAKGIIISSPVYFGDRSHLIDTFISFLKDKLLLKGKVIGCVSVGAKRNGGQETTIVYILKEVNDAGAYVVGNGPPTSQYGGTAWAGNIGAIREDEFGIMTSIGTGRKVAEVVSLINSKGEYPEAALRVAFWITRDFKNTVLQESERLMQYVEKNTKYNICWDIINFTTMNILPCHACNRCPLYQSKQDLIYKCKIKKDDFARQYRRLLDTDAVVVCGCQSADFKGTKDVYQKLLERTRSIRRDNFLLSNIPITSLSVEELPTNSLFSLKVMTSFLRHNTVIFPPLKMFLYNNKRLNALEDIFLDFLEFSMRMKQGRNTFSDEHPPIYLPVGYGGG